MGRERKRDREREREKERGDCMNKTLCHNHSLKTLIVFCRPSLNLISPGRINGELIDRTGFISIYYDLL